MITIVAGYACGAIVMVWSRWAHRSVYCWHSWTGWADFLVSVAIWPVAILVTLLRGGLR